MQSLRISFFALGIVLAAVVSTPAASPVDGQPPNFKSQIPQTANTFATSARPASLPAADKIGAVKTSVPSTSNAPKLYALLVCDTDNARIGEGTGLDRDHMLKLLQSVVDPQGRQDRVVPTVLDGENATPDNVLKYLETLSIDARDSLMIYYNGHGAHSETQGNEFTMKHGLMKRSVLRSAMHEKNARLSVLLTECADHVFGSDDETTPESRHRQGFADDEKANWDTFSRLFFTGAGKLVDINACKPGQFSRSNKLHGGYFSTCFVHAMSEPPSDIAGRNRLDWTQLSDHINALVETHFIGTSVQGVYRQFTNQWPQTFFDRTLTVKNDSKFPVQVHVEYMPHGQTEWISTPTIWTIAPGEVNALHDEARNNSLIAAEQVRVWADSDDGKHHWAKHKTDPLPLVTEHTGYADEQMASSTFRLK